MKNSEMVREFHLAFDIPVRTEPQFDIPEKGLRIKLLLEEIREYIDSGSMDNTAQELADILYVTYGAALCHGIDIDKVFAEVHRANMSKLDADGKVLTREDGKVLKSSLFRPADIGKIIRNQMK